LAPIILDDDNLFPERHRVAHHGGLRRAAGGGPGRGTASPGGSGPDLVLPPHEPSESLNLANINVNGNLFEAVANGSAFYRDVPPGHYHIAPESFGQDFNQDKDVDLVPGQQL
jgi:hypothetical protein